MPKEKIEEQFNAPIIEEEEKEKKPIEIYEDKIIVKGVEIERNKEKGLRVPDIEKFKDFIEDDFSVDLMQKAAKAVVLGENLLFEGEAACGKTSTIEYLAMLCNKEVYRMSLNGQIDTTDLIGKWVPQTESLKSKIKDLLSNSSKCKTKKAASVIDSKRVSSTIESKKRETDLDLQPVYTGFSKEEMQEICRLEGIDVPEGSWIWQDGEIPRAMKANAWLVLDEVNTAEPQVLVRLNALLEEHGQLILHEDGSKILNKKEFPDFRIMATTNPPGGEYRGRIPLSAEYISRWSYHNIGDLPQEICADRFLARGGITKEGEKYNSVEFSETLTDAKDLVANYGEEWYKDFGYKSVEFLYTAKKMINKGENSIAMEQYQKFDYDQRDLIRFEKYILKFRRLGNMKKTIEEAIDYCFLDKIEDKKERTKLKDIALKLIKVSEPKERMLKEKTLKKQLNNTKTGLIDLGIPKEHLDKIITS